MYKLTFIPHLFQPEVSTSRLNSSTGPLINAGVIGCLIINHIMQQLTKTYIVACHKIHRLNIIALVTYRCNALTLAKWKQLCFLPTAYCRPQVMHFRLAKAAVLVGSICTQWCHFNLSAARRFQCPDICGTFGLVVIGVSRSFSRVFCLL